MESVTTYYLEMTSPDSLKNRNDSKGLQVYECEIKQHAFN